MIDILNDIHDFILYNFLFGDESRKPHEDDSFLENGIVDSTGVVELIAFVETKYEIEVDDSELLPENFDTIKNLTEFIMKKQAQK